MNLNLLSADRARCNGNGESCCDTCARRLQIPLDDNHKRYPYTAAMAANGRCFLKIEAMKGFA